jgi:20S proteasome alpha/beta subunit
MCCGMGLMMGSRQPLVTGTSVLGLVFADGVMLAADNLGTSPKNPTQITLTLIDYLSIVRLPRAIP